MWCFLHLINTVYSISYLKYSSTHTTSWFSWYSFQDKGNVCLGVLDGTTIGYDSVIIVGGIQWSFSWQISIAQSIPAKFILISYLLQMFLFVENWLLMTMMRMRSGGSIQTAPTLADQAEFLPSCDERCTTKFCKYYKDATVKSADHACSYRRESFVWILKLPWNPPLLWL